MLINVYIRNIHAEAEHILAMYEKNIMDHSKTNLTKGRNADKKFVFVYNAIFSVPTH